jgi:hypothetical protein
MLDKKVKLDKNPDRQNSRQKCGQAPEEVSFKIM